MSVASARTSDEPGGGAGRWVLRGPVEGGERRFPLASRLVTIGSDAANQVVLRCRGVSRRHARLSLRPDDALVEDLASKNGTFVNGERVESRRVGPSDRLTFGPVELVLDRAAAGDRELAITLDQGAAGSVTPPPARDTSILDPHRRGAGGPPAGLVLPEGYVAGSSPAMAGLYRSLAAVAASDLTVLVIGETGAGKEWVARLLHASSGRRGRLLPLNCAALPADLLEAELFGVERGVATGVEARPGLFRRAAGGTLLLDEVGELPPPLQPKLLRALEDGELRPLGGDVTRVDTRVVAATNVPLERHLEEGRLRRDLYYRLAGTTVEVPPLRRRREDIPALVEALLRRHSDELGRRPSGLTVRALENLCAYPWPGNVRQLEHEIRRLLLACPPGQAIDSTMLDPRLRGAGGPASGGPVAGDGAGREDDEGDDLDLKRQVDALERRLIAEALGRTGGNRTHAARLLGITRNGLALKIDRLGLGDPDGG